MAQSISPNKGNDKSTMVCDPQTSLRSEPAYLPNDNMALELKSNKNNKNNKSNEIDGETLSEDLSDFYGGPTKKAPKRKRILPFSQIEDPAVIEQTKKHIEAVKEEVKGKSLVSLQKWCEDNGFDQAAMIRLLKEADLPIIKIGDLKAVYELHLDRVLYQETERQVEQQIQNRACARILALRQHGNGEKGFNALGT